MEKCYFFHSHIVPANGVVSIECFINEGCTTKRASDFSVCNTYLT